MFSPESSSSVDITNKKLSTSFCKTWLLIKDHETTVFVLTTITFESNKETDNIPEKDRQIMTTCSQAYNTHYHGWLLYIYQNTNAFGNKS